MLLIETTILIYYGWATVLLCALPQYTDRSAGLVRSSQQCFRDLPFSVLHVPSGLLHRFLFHL
jgi:hypothetical protein